MTTVSIINPEVVYHENNKIDEEDIGHKTQVYELDVDSGATISIVLGKPKYIYTSKNIIFFPIYAVHQSKIRAQIGVFEVKSTDLISVYRQGDIDADALSAPLLYSFVNPVYLASLGADPKLFEQSPSNPSNKEEPEEDRISPILENEMESDHLALKLDKSRVSKIVQDAESNLLEDATNFDKKDPLGEETKEDAEKERNQYAESARNTWIEKYMKNNQYRIHEVESNGDCFFAVIRDAFADIGKKTTVEKLRSALATEMTDDTFNEYRQVYLSFVDETQTLKRDLTALKKTLKEYETRSKQTGDRSAADTKNLVEQSKKLAEEKHRVEKKIKETEELQHEYTGDMSKIDTLEKMRQHILTPSYWADSWAISTIERLLNVKLVLFSQEAFQPAQGAADIDGVFLCSEVSKELQERQTFSPDYYIMATYSGDHYRLISYKSRKIFAFREVPYDVKILVLNRCLSRTSGVYYMIQDFRNLKTKFGIDEDEGAPDDYSEMPGANELFDPDSRLVFHSKSDKSVKPGKADGEKIKSADKSKYAKLGSGSSNDWRKMLDDDWSKTSIIIDSRKWASVTHYMQGVKYKKTHPDVYLMFSLDTDDKSDLATNVKTARAFKGLAKESKEPESSDTGTKSKKKKPADKKVQIVAPDLDFDEKREEEERGKALEAKFLDNADLRRVLKMTQNAMLLHKEKTGEPLVPDYLLMRVREKCSTESR